MKVTSVSEMAELDRRAEEEYGIKDLLLMENAGNALSSLIRDKMPLKNRKFAIFCGGGNNGGDGFVVARKLHSSGANVRVSLLSDSEKLSGITETNFEILRKIDLPVLIKPDVKTVRTEVEWADVIIDAMLGTGLTGELRGIYADSVECINNSGKEVICVDIPTGINGDTGQVMGRSVKGNYTVTFGLPKQGQLNYPGFDFCGELYVSHISFPDELYNDPSIKVNINTPLELKKRNPDSHKGSAGKCLFIAGSEKYLGAPFFSAESFLKSGGGLSYLATPESIAPFIGCRGSEIVLVPLDETEEGSISSGEFERLIEYSTMVDFVVLGPGISLNEETRQLCLRLIEEIDKPLLIDGDGLTSLTSRLDLVKKRKSPTIITPHPGEFSRLFGGNSQEIKKNRIPLVQKVASENGCIVVLKGAHSLIGYPDESVFINLTGNCGMATAGSGDVLTGTIPALFFQLKNDTENETALQKSVRMGVLIHGLAGDIASRDIGEDGMVAGDILKNLPEALKLYRENKENATGDIKVID